VLKIRNLCASYDEINVLNNVNFKVGEKEIISIIGSNGAGKSTLVNCISGIIRNKIGEIEFMGKRIDQFPPDEIVNFGLIQVPEGRLLFSEMSVMDNLDLGCYKSKVRKYREKNLERVFKLFPILEKRQKQIAKTLSGGEQQMLAIARAYMSMPKLLMMDEPSLGLAPIILDRVFEIIQEMNNEGITILLIEQNISRTLAISDRGYVLENGRITLEGTGKELLKNKYVKIAYLGI